MHNQDMLCNLPVALAIVISVHAVRILAPQVLGVVRVLRRLDCMEPCGWDAGGMAACEHHDAAVVDCLSGGS